MINLELKVNVYSEVSLDDGDPCLAKVTLTKELIARIKELHRALKSVKALQIEDFDYSPYLYTEKWDEDKEQDVLKEWEGSPDCECLVVREDGFYWSGLIKHTDIHWETAEYSLKELNENLKVLKAKKEDLLLYMNKTTLKYESSTKVLEARLKGE